MKTPTLALVAALALVGPAFAAGTYENGAKAYLVANEFCPDISISDEDLGAAIYLAAAEMGSRDVEETATLLGFAAAISGDELDEAGKLDEFCESVVGILGD